MAKVDAIMSTPNERLISLDENLIALVDIPDHVPRPKQGRKVHAMTVHRWIHVGLAGGIKLETLRVGGRVFSSHQALRRFSDRVSIALDSKLHGTAPTPSRAGAKANAELIAAGL